MQQRRRTTILHVDGLAIELTRGRQKTARLGLRPDGTIRLSAPDPMPERVLVEFVRQHRAWILSAREQQARRQAPREHLGNGGRLLLWGRWHEVARHESSRASANLEEGRVIVAASDDEAAARAVGRLRRRELERAVAEVTPGLEARVGQHPAGYRYRAMTSRWGVCNTATRIITLNTWLVQRPAAELEYVLVHELAHLIEPGHGPAFRAVVGRVLPDWQARRRALQATLPPRR